MARTIKDIKKSMTDQFMADPDLREMYGLKEGDTFDGSFSAVCLERILFGIVAAAVYALEGIFETFRKDVDNKLANSVVATIPWYHKICLGYQHGDELVLDDTTSAYEYAQEDDSKKLVKYAACRDRGGGVYILAAGEGPDGYPQALTNDVLTAFKEYVRKRKPAGVITDIYSYDPDDIIINLTVQYDPMLINPDGSLIRDESVFPVEDAVNGYLKNIIYGKRFVINLNGTFHHALGKAHIYLAIINNRISKQRVDNTFQITHTSIGSLCYKLYHIIRNSETITAAF